MTTHSTGRGLALVAGVLATSGALAILLQDAIRTGHWTIEHGLIPVLMAVQILTGHLFVAAARQRKALPALGFAVVAIVATWGVLDTSVAKQGAVQADATAKAEDVNGKLAEQNAELAKARQRLADAEKMVDLETGKGGCKSNCKDWKQRAAEVRSHIAVIEGEIAKIGPAMPVDARSENMATLIATLTGGDKGKIKHVLATVRPFTFALIFELAALVSFGFAFGHRPAAAAKVPADRPAIDPDRPAALSDAELAIIRAKFLASDDPGDDPNPGKPAPLPANVVPLHDAKSRTLRTIRDELAAGRTFPSQAELCRTIGVARSTMSDWLNEWEVKGVIPPRQTVGRCKRLAR
jgi:hypothetical protein